MKRCVKKVAAQGRKVNPHAVCRASIYKTPYLGRITKKDIADMQRQK